MLRIVKAGSAAAGRALAALKGRLERSTRLASITASARTKQVFGRALSPVEVVQRILSDVRRRGDAAVADYTKKFDRTTLTPRQFRVTEAQIRRAVAQIPKQLRQAIRRAKRNVERFQKAILQASSTTVRASGVSLRQAVRPLERVGLHVPGGLAPYPSTVLMNAIPAKVAGVKEIVIVSPPRENGLPTPATLAAASVCGVTEIYRIGGVQAIAALAYGTKTIRKVDFIAGPGNIFVTLAKKEVQGQVAIDMLAGPSEILVLADETTNPRWAAADLLSQAEHDPMASAILITHRTKVAKAVTGEVEAQIGQLSTAATARAAIDDYGIAIVTKSRAESIALANAIAPEHLEVMLKNPRAAAKRIVNAGAVFIGPFTPEAVGDYVAGPSHVLPTGGSARFSSALSANSFLKGTSVIEYDRSALRADLATIDALARAEGFEAHGRSANIRMEP